MDNHRHLGSRQSLSKARFCIPGWWCCWYEEITSKWRQNKWLYNANKIGFGSCLKAVCERYLDLKRLLMHFSHSVMSAHARIFYRFIELKLISFNFVYLVTFPAKHAGNKIPNFENPKNQIFAIFARWKLLLFEAHVYHEEDLGSLSISLVQSSCPEHDQYIFTKKI